MRRLKASKKKTAFVPRIVFRASIAGASVVPVCVAGCGNAFIGVAAILADAGDASDERAPETGVADGHLFTVAVVGFGDASDGSSVTDGGPAPEAGRGDGRIWGVAVIGFGDAGDAKNALDAFSMSVTMMAFGD
jgi:hypothetical protein